MHGKRVGILICLYAYIGFIFICCISVEPHTSLFMYYFRGALPYSESRTAPADKVTH
jgi:hypothetical protein